MAKKKISKWQKNLEMVQRAQKRAQALIFDLQYQGYQISKGQYDLVFRPLKSRYTEAEAKKYVGLVSAQRIKSYATNVYGMKGSSGSTGSSDSSQITLPLVLYAFDNRLLLWS